MNTHHEECRIDRRSATGRRLAIGLLAAVLVTVGMASPASAASRTNRRPGRSITRAATVTKPLRAAARKVKTTELALAPAPAPVPSPEPTAQSVAAWNTVFDGYGWVRFGTTPDVATVAMAPQASTRPDETHAGLVQSAATHADLDLSMQLRTVRQLRSGSAPNPWETAWALWHYTDNQHFYYVVLKPNGWELGKEDPAYPGAQRFLATGTTPFPVGPTYTVRVRQVGALMSVWVDGLPLASFVDGERPYGSGSIGLYSEDAEVEFGGISVTNL